MLTNAGFLLRHRGAVAAPAVDGRHPLRSARGLFASKWWTIGWVGAVAAWLLHVGALSLVQLSVVQEVISGGLGFLAVLAERFFSFHLGRRNNGSASPSPRRGVRRQLAAGRELLPWSSSALR